MGACHVSRAEGSWGSLLYLPTYSLLSAAWDVSSQGGCKDAGKWGGLRTWSENGRDCISTQVRFTCEPSASDSPTNRPPYRSSKAFAETWVRHYIKTRESSPFGPRSLTCDTTQPLLQGQSLSQRQEGGTGLLSGGTQADLDLRGRRRVSQQ